MTSTAVCTPKKAGPDSSETFPVGGLYYWPSQEKNVTIKAPWNTPQVKVTVDDTGEVRYPCKKSLRPRDVIPMPNLGYVEPTKPIFLFEDISPLGGATQALKLPAHLVPSSSAPAATVPTSEPRISHVKPLDPAPAPSGVIAEPETLADVGASIEVHDEPETSRSPREATNGALSSTATESYSLSTLDGASELSTSTEVEPSPLPEIIASNDNGSSKTDALVKRIEALEQELLKVKIELRVILESERSATA